MVMKGKKRLAPTIFPRKNRRGQFYLVAAIVIITILIGFSVVSNYSRNKEVIQLYDLKQELSIETARVLEYGTYQTAEADEVLSEFAENLADYAGEDKNMYFFFGNFQKVTTVAYQDLSEDEMKISLIGGGGKRGRDDIICKISTFLADDIVKDAPAVKTPCEGSLGGEGEMIQGEKITFEGFPTQEGTIQQQVHLLIEILKADYRFRLRTGENFYFVLEQRSREGRYVVSG